MENGTIIPLPVELTTPQTLIQTNAFMSAPQKLIDSSGTPTDKDINSTLDDDWIRRARAIELLVGVVCCVLRIKGKDERKLSYFHIGRILPVLMGSMSIFAEKPINGGRWMLNNQRKRAQMYLASVWHLSLTPRPPQNKDILPRHTDPHDACVTTP
ncbi:hypothetical protein BLNAU_16276 [Blattamonas nauphoetae]|uniref:Uncharacterized protein n=1 Tax=Blattamonas nauphoetae TaxID=2049346 RepID=A0ABQ9XA75_9EUKA|nr:hypothetical protein BLNAU_16276 [Blattamonas nauphoetae]